jgi:hypothetical protein
MAEMDHRIGNLEEEFRHALTVASPVLTRSADTRSYSTVVLKSDATSNYQPVPLMADDESDLDQPYCSDTSPMMSIVVKPRSIIKQHLRPVSPVSTAAELENTAPAADGSIDFSVAAYLSMVDKSFARDDENPLDGEALVKAREHVAAASGRKEEGCHAAGFHREEVLVPVPFSYDLDCEFKVQRQVFFRH